MGPFWAFFPQIWTKMQKRVSVFKHYNYLPSWTDKKNNTVLQGCRSSKYQFHCMPWNSDQLWIWLAKWYTEACMWGHAWSKCNTHQRQINCSPFAFKLNRKNDIFKLGQESLNTPPNHAVTDFNQSHHQNFCWK